MKLIIETQDSEFATEYIPEVLKDYIIKYYREIKARKLNTYLQTFNVKHSVRTAIMEAIDTLKIRPDGDTYILEVDKNKTIQGTPFNLETIIKVITYGTADMKGYDILVKALEFVSKRLKTLKKMYAARIKEKGE